EIRKRLILNRGEYHLGILSRIIRRKLSISDIVIKSLNLYNSRLSSVLILNITSMEKLTVLLDYIKLISNLVVILILRIFERLRGLIHLYKTILLSINNIDRIFRILLDSYN